MERRQGPTVTRHALAAALLLCAAGCGGGSNIQVGSAGGTSAGSTVSVQSGSSALGTLIAVGFLAGISYQSDRDYDRMGRYTTANPFSAAAPVLRVPEMDPARRIAERDCTKPIEDWSANLKCK